MTRKLGQEIWDSTGFAGSPENRRERAGVWGVSATSGARVSIFKTPTDTGDTPCKNTFGVNGLRADTEYTRMHSHGFTPGDATPPNCWSAPTSPMKYDATSLGGPSSPDWISLLGTKGWGVIYDNSYVYVYHAPPSVTLDSVMSNGVERYALNGWQTQIRQYARRTRTCSVY